MTNNKLIFQLLSNRKNTKTVLRSLDECTIVLFVNLYKQNVGLCIIVNITSSFVTEMGAGLIMVRVGVLIIILKDQN